MRLPSLAALVAVSSGVLGVSAGPLAKRQNSGTSSASSSAPTAGLVAGTQSDGKPTTFLAAAPTNTASATVDASATASQSASATSASAAPSRTGAAQIPTSEFPSCHAADAKPFCLPNNESTLYTGATYYVTWNPDFFPVNSTVTVKLQYINNTVEEVYSSGETDNSWGVIAVTMDKAWMQGFSQYNLTFYALNFEANDPTKQATPFKGPTITLMDKPPQHYQPPDRTKAPNKLGLMIGLPVSLGFVVLVVFGLWLGMRKQRTIGLGNIMGRRRGYGARQSKRQRLGLGKKGAIRLQERDQAPAVPTYRDAAPHGRDHSLGSLVSDDEIRPAPRGNQFRDEISRQKTGR